MKKNDLRTAIGGIKASDALVADTMDKIARYRTEQCESRGGSQRRFGLGLRIAAAACAFALVVGIGIVMSLGGDVPDTVSDLGGAKSIDNNEEVHNPNTPSNRQELRELRELAKGMGTDWMIVCATVDSCMMIENGVADVGLTVNDFLDYSEGFEFDVENITAKFVTDSQTELDGIAESLTSQRYFLLSCDRSENEYYWTIEKYL